MQLTWAGLCRLDECFPKWERDARAHAQNGKWPWFPKWVARCVSFQADVRRCLPART